MPAFKTDPEDLFQFMMETKNGSAIYSIRNDEGGSEVFLSDDEEFKIKFAHNQLDTGKLVGCVVAKSKDFEKFQGAIARVTTEGISIYTEDL